ncbi:MAG: PIG-L deacetylase family protein [Chloroflexota bacterium]
MEIEATLSKPLRILVIVAHPDDIEFGAAGSVIRWTDAGAEVTYCMITDGAAGSNDKDVVYAELVKRRQEEQNAAAKIAGVKEVRYLGYADGTLEPTLKLRLELTRLIREIRPDRVLINDPTMILLQNEEFNYINHPDHIAGATAALYAVFPSAESRPIFAELLNEGLEPWHVEELFLMFSDKPNLAVDVSAVHERKIMALLCHRSQLDEEAAEFVTMFDGAGGKAAGVEFAETFRVMRFVNEPQAAKDDPAD